MNRKLVLFLVLLVGGVFVYSYKKNPEKLEPVRIRSTEDIVAAFATTPSALASATDAAIATAARALDDLIAVPNDKRTYANTAHALDTIVSLSTLTLLGAAANITEMVHPEAAMRDAASKAVQKINDFSIEHIANNKALYDALKAYADGNAQQEELTAEQRYYLKETLRDFERSGLNLPEEKRKEVTRLSKELAKLAQDFDANIAADATTIIVTADELKGLDEDFIKGLKRSDNGGYVLGVDYPTYYNVIEHCSVASTRKKLFTAFNNRAYPKNDALLKQIIAKRDELAHLLGFESYAQLNLADSMAATPENASKFLDDLIAHVAKKVDQEFALLKKELPEGVVLTADGKMQPWDREYTKAHYKKKHYTLDERVITDYFPMASTIEGLLDIYRQFLGVDFKETPIKGLWHEDVRLIGVHSKENGALLGYLLLDLYPRENKYSHACHATIVPSTYDAQGNKPAALSLLITNFPKATGDKPALLRRDDVKTFFHEFGHAMHAMLGRTHVASCAGTSVKRDFVELPSQMLEEWLYDEGILTKISRHYITGDSLPKELIEKIQHLKQFDSGDWTQRQAYLSKYALACYAPGAVKDPFALKQQLWPKIRTHVALSPEDHMYASFGHLTGYGAQYYGYLWSKVYALDMFYEIKKHGLLNGAIGAEYVNKVIGKGGSQDPMTLLVDFLGRNPNQDAFMHDLGL